MDSPKGQEPQKLGSGAWDNPAYSGPPSPHGTQRICTVSSAAPLQPQPKNPKDGPREKTHGMLMSSCCLHICHSIRGLWGTALSEDTAENQELYIKTTLWELLEYIVFLVDICLCAGPFCFLLTHFCTQLWSPLLYSLVPCLTASLPCPHWVILTWALDFWRLFKDSPC